jgi:hypothetical protein
VEVDGVHAPGVPLQLLHQLSRHLPQHTAHAPPPRARRGSRSSAESRARAGWCGTDLVVQPQIEEVGVVVSASGGQHEAVRHALLPLRMPVHHLRCFATSVARHTTTTHTTHTTTHTRHAGRGVLLVAGILARFGGRDAIVGGGLERRPTICNLARQTINDHHQAPVGGGG